VYLPILNLRKEIQRTNASHFRLQGATFDILMNGRSGYRAQFYNGLEDGRQFNRALIDIILPALELAWNGANNPESLQMALWSLNDATAKIWPEMDIEGLSGEPKLEAKMWKLNCENTGASSKGLHLFSTKPPTIEVKEGWICDRSPEVWLPAGKRCRDELLRCFGFT
jgi:hypothetical protein